MWNIAFSLKIYQLFRNVLEVVAALKNIDPAELASKTYENADNLFFKWNKPNSRWLTIYSL